MLLLLLCLVGSIGVEWRILDSQTVHQAQLRYEEHLEAFRKDPQTYLSQYRCTESYDAEFREIYKKIQAEIRCFPVEKSFRQEISYVDSWYGARTYGGDRVHEGTDLMDVENTPGRIPVVSMTDGIVKNIGWLQLGGWRIGIESEQGLYYYYAHLFSYASGLEQGDTVYAGQLLGFMGDSGYGTEGTTGMFDVHLHVGIYFYESDGTEISINPYSFLRQIEQGAQ